VVEVRREREEKVKEAKKINNPERKKYKYLAAYINLRRERNNNFVSRERRSIMRRR
jgi:hypothetical protein